MSTTVQERDNVSIPSRKVRYQVSTDWAVFDNVKGRNIGQCRTQADAANICTALNHYNEFILTAFTIPETD